MTLITKSEELMAVSVRQGVELAAIEAKVLLGYLEGHDYSLMMDDKFHLALHDNQDGEDADNDQPYTIRDCIDFCQEMNSELLLEEAGKEGGDPDYFSELQKDELILDGMMERAKVALPSRTSTYDVVIVEYLKKVVPVEAASWEEAKMLVNDAFDGVDENGIIDGSSVISVGITYKFKKRGFDRGIPAAVAFDALLAQQADYDAQISQYVAERDAALAAAAVAAEQAAIAESTEPDTVTRTVVRAQPLAVISRTRRW